MIWKWLSTLWKKKSAQVQNKKQKDLNCKFAEEIRKKYEWRQEEQYHYVFLKHRKNTRQISVVQNISQQQIQQIIQKYIPKTVPSHTTMIQRQERTRLLSVIENIGRQDGEQKQLEQLIFRRKEQEWKKTIQLQEEEVMTLRQELIQQRKVIEVLERRVEEPVMDTGALFAEFRKKLEQQLRLERQRSGL